jgi:phospholipid/cholesterol/gamma-HCH transport system permease protein
MNLRPNANLAVEQRSPDVLLLRLSGNFRDQSEAPSVGVVSDAFNQDPGVKALSFECAGLTGWDSRFVAFIRNCADLCQAKNVAFQNDGLPEGARRLLRLAQAVPERKDVRHAAVKAPFFQSVGEQALKAWAETLEMLKFFGEDVVALISLLRGRAQFRWSDAFLVMEECGPQALGIVAMINFLVGLILAFVGAIELVRFGASIYVADLVGIATVREMGCIMTGIILCGRTGAAFAAQLGTMKVNEEISALQTFGISPVEFLVLPRMIALLLVMPFLCAFADFISIAGGFTADTLLRAVILIHVYVIGTWSGAKLFGLAPKAYFRRVALWLLIATGIGVFLL